MPDRVRAFKIERPQDGGSQTDESYTQVNIGEDYLDCAGLSLQLAGASTATADSSTFINRTAAGIGFADTVSGSLALSQLLTSAPGKPGSHNTTPDIIHWLANGGPGDGYIPGAVRSVVLQGMLLKSATWYTSSSLKVALYGVVYTYSGLLVSKVVRTLYVNNAAARTVTDTYSYSSPFAANVTRTWT